MARIHRVRLVTSVGGAGPHRSALALQRWHQFLSARLARGDLCRARVRSADPSASRRPGTDLTCGYSPSATGGGRSGSRSTDPPQQSQAHHPGTGGVRDQWRTDHRVASTTGSHHRCSADNFTGGASPARRDPSEDRSAHRGDVRGGLGGGGGAVTGESRSSLESYRGPIDRVPANRQGATRRDRPSRAI